MIRKGAVGFRSMVSNTSINGAVALVAATLLAAGCGGSSSSSSESSPTPSPTPTPTPKLFAKADACALLTATDASTALGATVINMASVQVPGACFYQTPDGTTTVFIFANVFPDLASASAVTPQQMAAAANGAYNVSNASVVNGIGDKAVEYTLNGAGTSGIMIIVFKANVVIMVALIPTNGAPVPANGSKEVESMATTAVGKLS